MSRTHGTGQRLLKKCTKRLWQPTKVLQPRCWIISKPSRPRKSYGHSDDSVCLDNSRYFEDEIECFDVAGVRLFLDDGTILFICYSSGVWRIFIEQEGSAPHKHKVCQETSEDDYSDEFYTEADVVRHEIASARN